MDKTYSITLDMRTNNVTENKEYQQVLLIQKELDYASLVTVQQALTKAITGVFLALGDAGVELHKKAGK